MRPRTNAKIDIPIGSLCRVRPDENEKDAWFGTCPIVKWEDRFNHDNDYVPAGTLCVVIGHGHDHTGFQGTLVFTWSRICCGWIYTESLRIVG